MAQDQDNLTITKVHFRLPGIEKDLAIVETYQCGQVTRHTLNCNNETTQHANVAAAKKALARKVGVAYKLLEQQRITKSYSMSLTLAHLANLIQEAGYFITDATEFATKERDEQGRIKPDAQITQGYSCTVNTWLKPEASKELTQFLQKELGPVNVTENFDNAPEGHTNILVSNVPLRLFDPFSL